MSEERNENLEVQEGMAESMQENATVEDSMMEEAQMEEAQMEEANMEEPVTEEEVEEYVPETVQEESVIEIEAEAQPEAILEQTEDGTWRHTEDSPFSPFYVPDRKQKKNNRLTIALVAVLLLMLLAGVIFAVSKLVETAMGEASTAWNESSNAVEEFITGIKDDTQTDSDHFSEDEPKLEDKDDYVEDWESFLKEYEDEYGYEFDEEHDDFDDYDYYEPSPNDDYYVELADAIRDDLSYSVEFEEYSYVDDHDYVYISVWYATVSDDLPFADKINEYLEEGAMYYAWAYESEDTRNFTLNVESFVTYMDEETLSVVVDERIYLGDEVDYNLYCMNFDLKTGTLLYNTDMIEVSDELVQDFREQSEYQNGYTVSVEDYSDEEIGNFMSDEESLILYYTPVGLEIGYNHPDGWVTATFKSYQKYLKKL